jgi:glycoprotein endo-alpha-1,2-mannosidase
MSSRRLLAVLALAALLAPAAARAAKPSASIFYYPWYGSAARDGAYLHWQQNGRLPPRDVASDFYPVRGAYSSGDPAVLAGQMREIASTGVREVVVSWWGPESIEAERLPAVLRAARARGLQVGIHLEPYGERTVRSVGLDVAALQALGITDFYVYRPLDFPATDWAQLNATLPGVRMFAQTPLVGFAKLGGFAGVYTYDVLVYGGRSFGRLCAQAHRAGLLCAPSVGPGYLAARATGDTRVKPRRRGTTYDRMWRSALRAQADVVTITSYNEWSEGTQIEPARPQPPESAYRSYDGAYGRHGAAAARAYVARTACWTLVLAGRLYPLTTPSGTSFATRRASAARSTTATTCSTVL